MKTAITSLLLALALSLLTATAADAASRRAKAEAAPEADKTPVLLNSHATVSGKFVRLGDIFSNTGEKSEINVAYAPDPGKQATFDARWLYRVARAYELDWRPLGKLDQIVIERESIVVNREEIEELIFTALLERGIDADMQVALSNRMLRVHLPANASGDISIEDVAYDPRSHRFTAQIVAPDGSGSAERRRVTGRVHRMVEVPALTRRVLKGEVITERDVQWMRVRADRMQNDVVLEAADVIGMTPKRSLRAGRAIRVSDVRRPVLVPKNGLVTMVLRIPYMSLTAQGKALEDGSDGDVIRIANSKTNTVVEGTVVGANRVAVRPTGQILMN